MEDVVHIRLLFVAGLLAMAGGLVSLVYAIARLAEWLEARTGRVRPSRVTRQTVKGVPIRGTR